MKRKRILSIVDIDPNIFLTSFVKASKLLIEKKKELENMGWTSIHLKMDYHYDHSELIVMGMRLENDIEFNKRKVTEEKKIIAKEKKLERERKKYKELKKKFES